MGFRLPTQTGRFGLSVRIVTVIFLIKGRLGKWISTPENLAGPSPGLISSFPLPLDFKPLPENDVSSDGTNNTKGSDACMSIHRFTNYTHATVL